MTSRKFPGFVLAGVALAALLGALSFAPPCRAQDGKAGASALDALPLDTTLFFRLKSGAETTAKFKASPFYSLKDHPDIKQLIDKIRKEMESGLSEARKSLGFDPMDLFGMVDGEAIFAVGNLDKLVQALMAQISGMEPDVQPGDLPFILVIDAGASAPKFRENLNKIFEFAQKEGAKKEVSDFKGGKITTLSEPKKAPAAEKKDGGLGDEEGTPKGGGLEKVYFGELGSRFLVGVSRAYLEQTMANLTAPAPDALIKSADFAATQREIGAGADMSFFLNFKSITASARKNIQSNPMAVAVWGIVEKFLGRGLKNVGGSLNLREGDLQQLAFVNNGGSAEGIFGVFKGQPFNGRPNRLIPADAEQFSTVSLNVPALYAMIKEIYVIAAPMLGMFTGGDPNGPGGGADQMPDLDQLIEKQFQVKMPEVIGAMGNLLHLYQKGGVTQDNPMGDLVVAMELKDEMPIQQLLNKFLPGMGAQPQKYLDRDFYPMGNSLGGGPNEAAPAIALGDKHLIFGLKGDSVKEAIRRAGKGGDTVADTPAYQAIGGKVPSQVTALTYANPKSFRESLGFVKKALDQMGEGASLPDLAIVGDLMSGSIGYTVWKADGIYSESIMSFKKGAAPKTAPAEKK